LLLLAAQFIDHLWPVLLLFGIERVAIVPGITAFTPLDFIYYPWTHSLLMSVAWGVVLGAVVYAFRKNLREGAVIAALVPGHWFLDLLSHRPDLAIAPGTEAMFGLGLWSSIPATIVVELALFAAGVFIYWTVTSGATRKSRIILGSLVAFLLVIYTSNVFGPPPPNVQMIAVAGNALWLVILWAWWVEKPRRQ
jgi:hypothetical protein